MVVAGQILEVARNPVRLTKSRCRLEHPREFPEVADQRAFLVVGQQIQMRGVRRDAEVCGVARERRQPGMRVLHVVHRVLVAGRGPQLQVDVDRGVHRAADQRVPGGVDTDRLDQVVEGDDGAGPLAHPHRLAVTDQVDHLPDQYLDGVGIVAERRGGGLEPGDVAVVVGAEHVDAQVEAALALVQEVGEVTGDVGGLTVALDDDAVLVVAEVGGAQPHRPVFFVDAAGVAQLGDRLLDPTGGVHRVFVGVDVEVGAELVQRFLDVVEHQVDPDGAERLAHLGVGQAQRVRILGQHLGGDVADVGAGVAVLGGRLALGGGDQRVGEPVDLRAVIVEVVLAYHLGALGAQQPAQRVADRGPARATDVDGAGGVGGDELEVDLGPVQRL